jgi:hypothetical protein
VRLRRNKDEEPLASETAVAAPPDPEDAAATSAPPPEPSPQTPVPSPQSPASASASASQGDDHPEILVGAAFVGGFALAQIVKRFGR